MAHTPGTATIPGGESSDGSRRGRGDRPDRLERYDRLERHDRHDRPGRDRGRGGMRIVLDETSKRIVEQLQQDGRRSYAAIGKVVGLSEAAVRQRVQRLIDGGVMQIVAVTDPMTLGFHRQTMIGIKCEGDLERVADHLAGMDEIDYVVITSGSFDLLVEVVCEDDDHLLEILSRVRMVPTVTSTETFVYLKLRKQTYSWGTR
jgi:Lrp/AsnC family transcriptional regulator, regulator for asnA, asnC and gidA